MGVTPRKRRCQTGNTVHPRERGTRAGTDGRDARTARAIAQSEHRGVRRRSRIIRTRGRWLERTKTACSRSASLDHPRGSGARERFSGDLPNGSGPSAMRGLQLVHETRVSVLGTIREARTQVDHDAHVERGTIRLCGPAATRIQRRRPRGTIRARRAAPSTSIEMTCVRGPSAHARAARGRWAPSASPWTDHPRSRGLHQLLQSVADRRVRTIRARAGCTATLA